jgi:hypothetical protein
MNPSVHNPAIHGLKRDALPPSLQSDAFLSELMEKFDATIAEVTYPDGSRAEAPLVNARFPLSASGELMVPAWLLWAEVRPNWRMVLLSLAGARLEKRPYLVNKKWDELKPEGRLALYAALCDLIGDLERDGYEVNHDGGNA